MDFKKLELYYFQIVDLWKKLCESHSQLLDLTFDEYSLLLGSQIEDLEEKIEEKQSVISQINKLENLRKDIMGDLNQDLKAANEQTVDSVTSLIILMEEFEKRQNQKHLSRFNGLLVDIIEKIQSQNKRNKMFLNKAIHSLKDIRESASGRKSYSTYNANGTQQFK